MSKKIVKENFLVTMADGSKIGACCGPGILSLGDAVSAYERTETNVPCMNRGDIALCVIVRLRAEKRKQTEKELVKKRAQAAILQMEIDELERRLG